MNSTLVLAHSKSYANAWENWSTGNPFNPAYMPLFGLPFSQKMGFFERVANTLATVLSVASRDWYHIEMCKIQRKTSNFNYNSSLSLYVLIHSYK